MPKNEYFQCDHSLYSYSGIRSFQHTLGDFLDSNNGRDI